MKMIKRDSSGITQATILRSDSTVNVLNPHEMLLPLDVLHVYQDMQCWQIVNS